MKTMNETMSRFLVYCLLIISATITVLSAYGLHNAKAQEEYGACCYGDYECYGSLKCKEDNCSSTITKRCKAGS